MCQSARVHTLLEKGAGYDITDAQKIPLAKTVRTCRQLLKVESALWTFVTTEGNQEPRRKRTGYGTAAFDRTYTPRGGESTLDEIEPTNNAAERALRPAMLWRKNSFGSQSQQGSLFVSRMLTVVTT